jgi:hypothetical protein
VDNALCTICGMDEEMDYHALNRCTRAVALIHEMISIWRLPDETRLVYSGPDWFLLLLVSLPQDKKENLLLVLWRTWHLRNDVIFR